MGKNLWLASKHWVYLTDLTSEVVENWSRLLKCPVSQNHMSPVHPGEVRALDTNSRNPIGSDFPMSSSILSMPMGPRSDE
jgi:hypothetical protein